MVKTTTISKCALVLATTFTLLSCSSNGDTVVAVNFSFDDSSADVKSNTATLHIKVGAAETDFTISRNEEGAITSGSWKRMVVNGMSGSVTVTITAKDESGSTLLEVSQDVVLVEHGAIEVFLKLNPSEPESPPDGTGGSTGAGGTGEGGSGGGGSGAGGTEAENSGTGGTT
jgi:uncharacterized membrane protein YgcG